MKRLISGISTVAFANLASASSYDLLGSNFNWEYVSGAQRTSLNGQTVIQFKPLGRAVHSCGVSKDTTKYYEDNCKNETLYPNPSINTAGPYVEYGNDFVLSFSLKTQDQGQIAYLDIY